MKSARYSLRLAYSDRAKWLVVYEIDDALVCPRNASRAPLTVSIIIVSDSLLPVNGEPTMVPPEGPPQPFSRELRMPRRYILNCASSGTNEMVQRNLEQAILEPAMEIWAPLRRKRP